ncbi:MAG: BlaI/MecI/CopY family transcriptional regulator [Crenarchaeota archaeon]|nr:BlaI/MecI/CopY family transcriptional regulator [Thermoproteota archaeon]
MITVEEKRPAISQYNVEGKQLEAFLGPLEASILQTVWCSKRRPITVREVLYELQKKKSIAYTTVMNTMDRLYEKDLLDRKIQKSKGGAYLYYVYWPKLEEANFKEVAVRQVLGSLMDNFDELVTTCLVERAAINDKQLEVLKEKIDKTLKERRNEQHVKL